MNIILFEYIDERRCIQSSYHESVQILILSRLEIAAKIVVVLTRNMGFTIARSMLNNI